MEKLADKQAPTSSSPTRQDNIAPSPPESEQARISAVTYTATFDAQATDVFESSAASNVQCLTSSLTPATNSSCASTCASTITPLPLLQTRFPSRSSKHASISSYLHALFPPQRTLYALSQQSFGARFVLDIFYSEQEQNEGKAQPISSLANVPDVSSHPAMLAKHLLQLAICLQQMPPWCDVRNLHLDKSPAETLDIWVSAAARLVTSDDDLLGSLEGLECLILQGYFQSDAGQLRKAWMTSRRALNLGQLMGIDRKTAKSIRSCDPAYDSKRRPSSKLLWFRITCSDRYLSLILGLPIGSHSNSFADDDDDTTSENTIDKLAKVYALISGRIADRNGLSGSDAYALTQSIDLELENAFGLMDKMWWKLPNMSICCSTNLNREECNIVGLQVRHFTLLILLHLPYLLRDCGQRRYEYNRATCMQASRDVLVRFLEYRTTFTTAVSNRLIDYSALVAAMTLLLGYLGWRWPGFEQQRLQDMAMAEKIEEKMRDMASLNNDHLCMEAADTIRHLLPIVQRPPRNEDRHVHLKIPFLGTVNISPGLTPPATCSTSLMPSTTTTPTGIMSAPDYAPFSFSLESPATTSGQACGDVHTSCLTESPEDLPCGDWPYCTADLEDWALQGVDTTYWSMLNDSIT